MTLTDTEIESDLFTVLDFDPAIPCDYMIAEDEHCPNEAVWLCILTCCGTYILYCQSHFDAALDAISEGRGFHHQTGRNACGADSITKPFASAERINKSIT